MPTVAASEADDDDDDGIFVKKKDISLISRKIPRKFVKMVARMLKKAKRKLKWTVVGEKFVGIGIGFKQGTQWRGNFWVQTEKENETSESLLLWYHVRNSRGENDEFIKKSKTSSPCSVWNRPYKQEKL